MEPVTRLGIACRAPEQADAKFGARGAHSDVWGFAATMLHLVTGEQPYKDLTIMQMATAMLKAKPPRVPETLPAWLQHLLKQCFSFDVTERPPVLRPLQVNTVFVWLRHDSTCYLAEAPCLHPTWKPSCLLATGIQRAAESGAKHACCIY